MAKRPSFQFYPGDWLRSTDLRSCSVAARGLWIDMICLMHEGVEYGYLKVGSKVILPPNLARMVGATLLETEGWLEELVTAGVVSVDQHGCYLCRRMIRDEEIRASRAAGGVKGGNPALTGCSEGSAKVGTKVNLRTNLQPTPASSSASSSASAKEEKEFSFSTDEKRTEGDRLTFPVGPSPESTRFFDAYPKKTKRNLVPDAFVRAVDAVAATHGLPEGQAAEWLIAKAQTFAQSPMGSQNDKEKIPNPAAWLDEGRYDDGPGEWELAKPPDKYHQKPKIRPLSEEQKELQNWNIP